MIIDVKVADNLINGSIKYDLWHNINPSNIFAAHFLQKYFAIPKDVIIFRHDFYDRYNYLNEPIVKNIKFCDDFFAHDAAAFTVTYSCLQLAVYMGFKEIYLLGVDCNYSGTNDHAFNYQVSEIQQEQFREIKEKKILDWGGRMQYAYKAAKKYADEHGIKIYNATRGGKLEVFERVTLEEALKS